MRVSTSAGEWLHVLRAHTSAAHRSLESHPILSTLGQGKLSLEAYISALRALAAPQLVMETAAAGYAERYGALFEYRSLARAPWLLQDLSALDTEPAVLENAWPPCDTRAQYIGALYVLEGSRFGAQVIARRLNQFLPAISANTFFRWTMPPQWSTFVENASAYATNADEVAKAANEVFGAIRNHLDSILSQ